MSDFEIRGAEQFLALSKRLKREGQTGLRKELNKAMRDAAKPLIPKVRAAARADLPHRGGLAERIARKPYRVKVSTAASTAGVSIVGTKVDPRINAGRVYHPVFGHRPGVTQSVRGGYFDRTLSESGPSVLPALEAAVIAVADRVAAG